MATDLERLVLTIEANTKGIERGLKRVEQQVNGSMGRAARSTKQFNTALDGAAKAAGRLVAAYASIATVRAGIELVDSAKRIENALKVAGLAGEELSTVYDRLFESAQRNAAPLEALVQLYGRASLVQKELGITSEELLGFTDKVAVALRVSGKSAQESSGALLQLSQALGSGVVRAEEFNSILEGALPVAQAAAAGLEEAGGSVAKLRQLVVDGKVSSEAFFRAFEAGSTILDEKVAGAELTVSQGFIRLMNVLIDTASEFDEATGTSELLVDGLESVGDAVQDLGGFLEQIAGPVGTFNGYLETVAGKAESVAKRVDDAAYSIADSIARGLFGDRPEFDTLARQRLLGGLNFEEPNASLNSDRFRGAAPAPAAPPRRTVSLGDYAAPEGDEKARKKAASEAERQRKAIEGVIETLDFEHRQMQRNALQQEIYNNLERAGVSIESEKGQIIATSTERNWQLEQSQRAVNEATQFFGDLAQDAFTRMIPAIETGNEALDRLLNTLIEATAQAALLGSGPLAGLFGGGMGSQSGGGGLGGLFAGFFANGGKIPSGKFGIAGEAGPEIITGPATVTPVARASSSSTYAPVYNIDARGADQGAVERMQRALAERDRYFGRSVMAVQRQQDRNMRVK